MIWNQEIFLVCKEFKTNNKNMRKNYKSLKDFKM